MAGIFDYNREAVRVKVKKCEGLMQPEYRKFSVDPQITSFEVLQSLLARAFDIKGEFIISYQTKDDHGHEVYLSLLSDWDLDAAFLSASEPCLCLRVDLKPFEESVEDWDIVGSTELPRAQGILQNIHSTEIKTTQNRLPGLILNQVEKTFNLVQRALNLVEEPPNQNLLPPRPPVNDAEFRNFLGPLGHLLQPKELRHAIYQGGLECSLRKVVWKHILNVYPDGMNGKDRMDYMKRKANEYQQMKQTWKDMIQNEQVTDDLKCITNMVRKDVLRTDRHHKFYAGSDDNQNIASLFNILTTYALNHPSVSYCQGMSDLASPVLVTMNDEAQAYICFCALMQRLKPNFMMDGISMTQRFQHLTEGLMYYDYEFYSYLKAHQADDLLFCYRWLLLELKREFAFEEALRMLEVLWSSLPPNPPEKDLDLCEVKYIYTALHPVPFSPSVKNKETAYTKVCALRRQSSTASLHSPRTVDSTLTSKNSASGDDVSNDNWKHRESSDDSSLEFLNSGNFKQGDEGAFKQFYTLDGSCLEITNSKECDVLEAKSTSVSPFELISMSNSSASSQSYDDSTLVSDRTESIVGKVNGEGLHRVQSLRRSFEKKAKSQELLRLEAKSCRSTEMVGDAEKPRGKIIKNLNEFYNISAVKKSKLKARAASSPMPEVINRDEYDGKYSPSQKIFRGKSDSFSYGCSGSAKDGFEETDRAVFRESAWGPLECTYGNGDYQTDGKLSEMSVSVIARNKALTSEKSLKQRNSCGGMNTTQQANGGEDEGSTDDSAEYFPITTSVTRELKLELENLDRQVFGKKVQRTFTLDSEVESPVMESFKSLDDRSEKVGSSYTSSGYSSKTGKVDSDSESQTHTQTLCELPSTARRRNLSLKLDSVKDCSRGEDIYLWENPLQCTTPDEQADLEYDGTVSETSENPGSYNGEIMENEETGELESRVHVKSVTPIKLLQEPKRRNSDISDSSESEGRLCQVNSLQFKDSLSEPVNSACILQPQEKNTTVIPSWETHPKTSAMDAALLDSGAHNNEMINSCEEVSESTHVSDTVSYCSYTRKVSGLNYTLPPPHEFGQGNPFLMFLCLTLMMQHRDYIMHNQMDYNELAMHFDKMVRKHDVNRVLNQARQMFAGYLKQYLMNRNESNKETNSDLNV